MVWPKPLAECLNPPADWLNALTDLASPLADKASPFNPYIFIEIFHNFLNLSISPRVCMFKKR